MFFKAAIKKENKAGQKRLLTKQDVAGRIAKAVVPLLLSSLFLSSALAEIQWTGIVIHHSDSDFGTVEDIDRWHKERGWDGIGYHFVIYRNGSIRKGKDLGKIGAHAKGRNKTHIGICLIGRKFFTSIQKANLRGLCEALAKQFPIKSIERHHELCPGEGLGDEFFSRPR